MEYPKIQTVWLRDPKTFHRTLLEGEWALPEFKFLRACEWEWTEKVDGTNIRIAFDGMANSVQFAGRTDRAQIPGRLYARLRELFPPEKMSATFGAERVTLYGEGYGAGIQKPIGACYLADAQDFILFDVRIGEWWLERENVAGIAGALGIRVVPVVGYGTLDQAIDRVRRGYPSTLAEGRCTSEGLIVRPTAELRTRAGDRIISKIKHKDFAPDAPMALAQAA